MAPYKEICHPLLMTSIRFPHSCPSSDIPTSRIPNGADTSLPNQASPPTVELVFYAPLCCTKLQSSLLSSARLIIVVLQPGLLLFHFLFYSRSTHVGRLLGG